MSLVFQPSFEEYLPAEENPFGLQFAYVQSHIPGNSSEALTINPWLGQYNITDFRGSRYIVATCPTSGETKAVRTFTIPPRTKKTKRSKPQDLGGVVAVAPELRGQGIGTFMTVMSAHIVRTINPEVELVERHVSESGRRFVDSTASLLNDPQAQEAYWRELFENKS